MSGECVALISILFSIVLCLVLSNVAWRNGVVDGYGYSVEPRNPGYKDAGDFLKKNMTHRWIWLKNWESVHDSRSRHLQDYSEPNGDYSTPETGVKHEET